MNQTFPELTGEAKMSLTTLLKLAKVSIAHVTASPRESAPEQFVAAVMFHCRLGDRNSLTIDTGVVMACENSTSARRLEEFTE
jgi:hypothetical protein